MSDKRPNVTYEEVVAAAETLEAEGTRATIRAVREKIGRGSMGTIQKHLQKWGAVAPFKIFISYSWSNEAHQEWVRNLAERLMNDGIDVVLDEWDLKPGQDMFAFMESMVTDPDISRVLIVCDQKYAEKANSRTAGGVTTETQIITPQLYADVDQRKFIPICAEYDETGKPFVPIYLKGRIFIDLSNPQVFEEGYERLVRDICGKPKSAKPQLGKLPSFIIEDENSGSATHFKLTRVLNLLQKGDRLAKIAANDYLDGLLDAFSALKIDRIDTTPLDELLWTAVGNFKLYRDEFVVFADSACKYGDDSEPSQLVDAGFFERLLESTYYNADAAYVPGEFEAARFVVLELFLCLVAVLIKHRRASWLSNLLSDKYFIKTSAAREAQSFTCVYCPFREINEVRRSRLQSQRTSHVADLIKERCTQSILRFDDILQADILLYLRWLMGDRDGYWYPQTAVYTNFYSSRPLGIFLQATSSRWKSTLLAALNVIDLPELVRKATEAMPDRKSQTIRINGFHDPWIPNLMNMGELAPGAFRDK